MHLLLISVIVYLFLCSSSARIIKKISLTFDCSCMLKSISHFYSLIADIDRFELILIHFNLRMNDRERLQSLAVRRRVILFKRHLNRLLKIYANSEVDEVTSWKDPERLYSFWWMSNKHLNTTCFLQFWTQAKMSYRILQFDRNCRITSSSHSNSPNLMRGIFLWNNFIIKSYKVAYKLERHEVVNRI